MSEVIIFYYSYELYDIFITVDTRPFKSAPNTGNKNINREFVSKNGASLEASIYCKGTSPHGMDL